MLLRYKAIIIDDEHKARNILRTLLSENCQQIEIVAEAEDVPSGVKAINTYQPHLVFSDIDMPNYNGFQLLEFVDKTNFELIYCTAHNEYALKAFEVSAIDYLLKPIQISQLTNAVQKAIRLIEANSSQSTERLNTLKENLKHNNLTKIALPVSDGLIFVDINDIVHLEADGSYTMVFLKDNQKILISKKIKEFENILNNNSNFFRTHRSHIINKIYIKKYIKTDGGTVILDNNKTIPIARERKDEFQSYIDNLKL